MSFALTHPTKIRSARATDATNASNRKTTSNSIITSPESDANYKNVRSRSDQIGPTKPRTHLGVLGGDVLHTVHTDSGAVRSSLTEEHLLGAREACFVWHTLARQAHACAVLVGNLGCGVWGHVGKWLGLGFQN